MTKVNEKPPPLPFLVRCSEIILNEQTWILLIFLIPISLVYDALMRIMFYFHALGSDQSHGEKVKFVQEQVRTRAKSGDSRPMCTSRPDWKSVTFQKLTYKNKCYQIKVNMSGVISMDTSERKVIVEPMIDIGTLNDYLVSRGWTLPIVPELDELTIGGLVMGGGIESTSNKYGLFQYICSMYELVMPDGNLVKCDASTNPELYCSIPFCYGTLGLLTAVEIDIIPYKPYIRLTYTPKHSLSEYVKEFSRVVRENQVDSIEGLLYSKTEGVVMTGEFVDSAGSLPVHHMGSWYSEWFYTYVKRIVDSKEVYTEIIPSQGFYHRHNKSWFWLMEFVFGKGINHPLFRYTLGWAMPPKFSFIKFLRHRFALPGILDNFVCQDLGFELGKLEEALEFVDATTKIYPLWLCPMQHIVPEHLRELNRFESDDIHVDVGIYGFSPIPGFHQVTAQKVMEKYCLNTGAMVALYAETQLTSDEFHKMFAKSMALYYKVRKDYNCDEAFPNVYEKISRLGRASFN